MLRSLSSSGIRWSPNNYPGYPRGRLLVIKHRQLVRQVGAFGGFASESSMDLDNMIFPTWSKFIFGSWVCKADSDGKLSLKIQEPMKNLTSRQLRWINSLRSFHGLWSRVPLGLQNTTLTYQELNLRLFDDPHRQLSTFFIWALQHSHILSYTASRIKRSVCRILLSGAQGLVLVVTPQDCSIQWPGSITKDNNTWLVNTAMVLPFQMGDLLYDYEKAT